jgi:hypothetical protein
MATYKGDMEDEDEARCTRAFHRYAAGVENNFGLLLVPDDVTIATSGSSPRRRR